MAFRAPPPPPLARSKTAKKEEKVIYKASITDADTCWCHHLTEDGSHVNLAGLPSSAARKCRGVIYLGIGWGGKKLTCKAPRDETDPIGKGGHDPCNAGNCPFMKEAGVCPYMPPKK